MNVNAIEISDEQAETWLREDLAEAREEVANVLHSNSCRILEALADLRGAESRLDDFLAGA